MCMAKKNTGLVILGTKIVKDGASQTLTGLGKWWGRKPLVLVRAAILGCLMPASDNPIKDNEIFLKLLSMDNDGLWLRKDKSSGAV